jgi:hypothetical protein
VAQAAARFAHTPSHTILGRLTQKVCLTRGGNVVERLVDHG